MAEEFVDLYQVLDLPIDADRGTVRKRINELYLDAQRNIDHRHFATRVKFQELFEVTLPQARYILLDDGRRDEYNRLVNASRATGNATGAPGGPAVPPPIAAPVSDGIPGTPTSSGFSLEIASDSIPGNAPAIEPLPQTPVDAEQLAKEREELWKKWKTGLEAALTVEEGDKPKARGAVTSAPTSFSVATTPESATAPVAPSTQATASVPVATPKTAARPKVEISFDTDDKAPARSDDARSDNARSDNARSDDTAVAGAEDRNQPAPAEIEARRTEHRRQITKDILVNVALIWGVIGAALVIVPGVVALIATVAHYYPRGAKPILGYPSLYLWIGGFLVMGVAAFFASRQLSKTMRRKKATELSLLSYEEMLKQTGKS